jgi:beta-lactamase regulating signal transducer with metallopeptidase domain
MSEQNPQQQDELALQYLAEVANTYAESLAPVVRAPFVAQVNRCIASIKEGKDELKARISVLERETEKKGRKGN